MVNRSTFIKLTTLGSVGAISSSYEFLKERINLPKVLIIGDSISIGYYPFVKDALLNKVDLHRPILPNGGFENCAGTSKGLKNISEWLGDIPWDLIHFNFGLHDIKHINPINGKNSNSFDDPHQASPKQYKDNLGKIVKTLKKTKAKLIFATTTPYPNSKLKPARKYGMPEIYNQVALSVMKKHKVKINDLHSFVLPRMNELQRPFNVHFSKYGSKELAKVVIKSILQNL
tara:strand:- start:375 stop:1064 length:690 start_codon:yes stop_codon:yes gene_type:complete